MMTRARARWARLGAITVITCGLGLFAVSGAVAAGGNAVLNDCQAHNGTLAGHYTKAQLQHALNVMPSYEKQYSSCYDVINNALANGRNLTGGAGSGSGGSFLPTPVIVILVLLILGAGGFAVLAWRSRRKG